MKLQGRNLSIQMQGEDVKLLHNELRQLSFTIPTQEADRRLFGVATHQAVVELQKKYGLSTTGVVDEHTASLITGALLASQPPTALYMVKGQIRRQDGAPLPGVTVRALDKDLRGEELLGEAISSADGRYEIAYTSNQFRQAEKGSADLIVRAFTKQGELLGASEIAFNAPPTREIDLIIVPPQEPKLSEFEKLLDSLAPSLQDVAPADLTKADESFLVGETKVDLLRLEALVQSAKLARETDVPTAAFYGFARQNLPLSLERVLAQKHDVLRKALETAIANTIIPAALSASLDQIISRFERLKLERGFLLRRKLVGRLIDQDTDAPLARFSVRATDLDAYPAAVDIGYDITNAKGLFALAYTIARKTSTSGEPVRRLRLTIIDPHGKEIEPKKDIVVHAAQSKVVDIPVKAPPIPEPPSPPVDTLKLALPQQLRAFLAAEGLRTLADIRKKGGLGNLIERRRKQGPPKEELPDPNQAEVRRLDAHADLGVISANLDLNTALIEKGFTSVLAVANATRADFVAAAHSHIGYFQGAQMHEVAGVQSGVLNNLLAAVGANLANGYSPRIPLPFDAAEIFPARCACKDCDAAVSPLAYLADLLQYTLTHLKHGADPLTVQFLIDHFYQPFADLPVSCEDLDRQVRQVRICIEVLRGYLQAHPPLPVRRPALEKAEKAYRMAAYTMLLTRIGTSYAEIRLARMLDAKKRKAVADRLGIHPDHLAVLFLDPDASGEGGVSENSLERIFGLADTRRDPLSEGAKRGDTHNQLTRWSLSGVEWSKNTDIDGRIYVRLRHPGTEDYRVELYTDREQNRLVAFGQIAARSGTVDLVEQQASGLTGRFGIDFAQADSDIVIAAIPELLSWRLQQLGTLWQKQDWPADPYIEVPIDPYTEADLRPFIDPDVIGPDDFRNPMAKAAPGAPDQAFDLWIGRRAWVDASLISIRDTRAASGLDAVLLQLLGDPLPDLDALLKNLTLGVDLEAARGAISAMRLTVDSFTRLMSIRAKDQRARSDSRNESVADQEWEEAYSIIVQAQKVRQYPAWRAEERAATIVFGPQDFWICLREPGEGAWPPALLEEEPIVDPSMLKLEDLPEPAAGQQAIAFWEARRARLEAIMLELQSEREAHGFDALLRMALNLHPDDQLPDLTAINNNLNSIDPALVADAEQRIIAELHLTVEAFKRLVQIAAKNADPDSLQRPTAEEWAEVYAILTLVRKVTHDFPDWVAEERQAQPAFAYWRALKARLPRWRASSAARRQWQQALLARSMPPIVDPDLINTGHLRNPVAGDPAYDLWASRHNWMMNPVNGRLARLRAARTHEASALAGLDLILESAFGVPLASLLTLEDTRNQGSDITSRLDQLSLSVEAFAYLLRIRDLAAQNQPILASEWDEVYSILAQVEKRRVFAEWRAAERERDLILGPAYFSIPELPVAFPPPEPAPLPAWRATWRELRDWQDTLQSRLDQQNTVVGACWEVVGAVEEETLPPLRDALITASNVEGGDVEAKGKQLLDRLLIDTRVDGCQKTTRIAQAIETLQGLLWSMRTAQLSDTYPELILDLDHFDKEWEWIGSYATWRAAMFVFLYPENILLPSLRQWQTPGFRQLVGDLRTNQRLTPEQACQAARTYSEYFQDICSLRLEASCQTHTRIHSGDCRNKAEIGERCLFYMFARGGATNTLYWSAHDPQEPAAYAQTFWEPVPGLKGVVKLIGATPYQIAPEERYIWLFAQIQEKGQKKLVFVRYDLVKQTWAEESTPLDLPAEEDQPTTDFTAVVKQTHLEDQPPHLAIRIRGGAIYDRRLNRDGTDWEDIGTKAGDSKQDVAEDEEDGENSADTGSSEPGDEWKPLIGRPLGRKFDQLCAMVAINQDEFFVIARTQGGSSLDPWSQKGVLKYRLFGERDDGQWTDLGEGSETSFRGAFTFPASEDLFVFWRTGSLNQYGMIRVANSQVIFNPWTDIQGFDGWLQRVAGMSLNQLVIGDGSQYDGLTMLQFFTLEDEQANEEPAWSAFTDFLNQDDYYRQRGRVYIDFIAGKLESNESGWKEWKRADELVRQFTPGSIPLPGEEEVTQDSLSLPEVLKNLFGLQFVENKVSTYFRSRESLGSELLGPHQTMSGLGRIVPSSGAVPTDKPRQVAYWRGHTNGEVESYRCYFARLDDQLIEDAGWRIRVTPYVTGPFDITERLFEDDLQLRKSLIASQFTTNAGGPQSNLAYLEEAYYFVPVHLALQLQQHGQYVAALDWFRTVYDYGATLDKRKIYPGLSKEEDASWGFERAEDWLLDPLNPHAIAATRAEAYTRFTLLSLVRCFLDYADAEFTRDTAESVPRARTLYLTALELLNLGELSPSVGGCEDLMGTLEIEVEDPQWAPMVSRMMRALGQIFDHDSLGNTIEKILLVMAGDGGWDQRFAGADAVIRQVLAKQAEPRTLAGVLGATAEQRVRAHKLLLGVPGIFETVARVQAVVAQDFLNDVVLVSGIGAARLQKGRVEVPWLGQRRPIGPGAAQPVLDVVPIGVDGGNLRAYDPFAPTYLAALAQFADRDPWGALGIVREPFAFPFLMSGLSFQFCIPANPVLKALRLHAELNLYKLRHCRNIAGMERELEPYAAPTDKESGLPIIGAGGQLILPGTITLRPTPYRYSVLVERAKQLVQLAAQIEAAMLSALEKRDAEYYNLIKARQDMRLAQATIRLQDLKVKEAEGGVKLAELQQERAQIQADRYKQWLAEPISELEFASLAMLNEARRLSLEASAAAAIPNIIAGLASGTIIDFSGIFSGLAQAASTQATILSTLAGYERRAQQWQLDRDLALQDVAIGAQQVKNANDHVRVAGQERLIAGMQSDHAQEVFEFLANKFTNVELYDWMGDILERVYSFFLQQATSMAQIAAGQLAFERQEVPPAYIQADYWEAPAEGGVVGSVDGRAPDRRGLTGSARLLQDIYQLDQHAFDTNKRKLQLTKTISLAQLAPFEFQRFRETGVLSFTTPMELFDRDFPGHYLRLIHKVRTSVIALIPPTQGIHATLATTGLSHVVIGPEVFQSIVVRRDPESVALTSPRDATGLFELQQQPEMLLPFEGMGVDTTWEFRLPKAANVFDYRTIADLLIIIDYTALDNFDYRQQVIQELDAQVSANRPFSFRHQFADQWYDLHNPDQTLTPMIVRFKTIREDFPPNIEDLRIEQIVLYVARSAGQSFPVTVTHLHFTEAGATGFVGGAAESSDGVMSTRAGSAGSWTSMITRAPIGMWELALPNTAEMKNRFKNEEIEDILLVITYGGHTPEWLT